MKSGKNLLYSTTNNGSSYTMEWFTNYTNNTSSTSPFIKTVYDKNGNIIQIIEDLYTTYTSDITEIKPLLTSKEISETTLVPTTEERLENYIEDHCDRYIVNEYGSYIYQMIQEKAYDIASEVVEEAKEEYDIQDEDEIIEAIVEAVDFDSMYELVEDILHAPITMEEKLADVGMSISDFL